MSPEGQRTIVLVVDDTPDTLGFLTEALEKTGYMALVATGGPQCLALVERITPDLILLDAVMPGMDGFETCRRLKAGSASAIPVIFMTALNDTENIVQGLEAGGVDYLAKPIVLDELFARIRVHLANAKATQSARLALDSSGSFLLALDRGGAVLWSTPQAMRLIEPLVLQQDGGRATLPAALMLRLDRASDPAADPVIAGEGDAALKLVFVGTIGADEILFRVSRHDARGPEEALRGRFGLTAREAEVLLWVARGKANRDIGEILDLSPRTVNKHLETIFSKLGVENRASAAVLAARALDER